MIYSLLKAPLYQRHECRWWRGAGSLKMADGDTEAARALRPSLPLCFFILFNAAQNEMLLMMRHKYTELQSFRSYTIIHWAFQAREPQVAYSSPIETHWINRRWPLYMPQCKNKHEDWIIQLQYENQRWNLSFLLDSVAVMQDLCKDLRKSFCFEHLKAQHVRFSSI